MGQEGVALFEAEWNITFRSEIAGRQVNYLVRQHSKLAKEARQFSAKASVKQMRRQCHRDMHKFSRQVLDDDKATATKPSFSKQCAEEYFS